jgi:hypothetical protein
LSGEKFHFSIKMSFFTRFPNGVLWVRKLEWPNCTFLRKNVIFHPKAFSGFNIYMKPNEAQCEENQGFRGEKTPPPIAEPLFSF